MLKHKYWTLIRIKKNCLTQPHGSEQHHSKYQVLLHTIFTDILLTTILY